MSMSDIVEVLVKVFGGTTGGSVVVRYGVHV